MRGKRERGTKRWAKASVVMMLGAAVLLLGFAHGRAQRRGAGVAGQTQTVQAPPVTPAAPPRLVAAPQEALATATATGTPGISDAPAYQPRDPEEWQGMRVDLSIHPACDRSERCGLALACQAGQCGPCTQDSQCAAGEACVLDHCLPAARVGCRTRRDCAAGSVCMLSGTSGDARGNREMRALCSDQVQVPAQEINTARLEVPAQEAPVAGPNGPRAPGSHELLERLRASSEKSL